MQAPHTGRPGRPRKEPNIQDLRDRVVKREKTQVAVIRKVQKENIAPLEEHSVRQTRSRVKSRKAL